MLPTNRGCSYFTHVDGSQKYGEQCSHGWVFQFSTVTHNEVKQKKLQFKGTLKQMKLKQKIGMVIWFATQWAVWNARNQNIFEATVLEKERIVESAKLQSWKWLKVRRKSFVYSFINWCSNPLECISSCGS